MATRKVPNQDGKPELEKLTFEVDNGDLQFMNSVREEWKFLDEASVLRFALAVLSRAKNKKVYIDDDTGTKVPLVPGQQLLKPEIKPPSP